MPGDALLVQLMKWTGIYDPDWYIGVDLYRLRELMQVDSLMELHGKVKRMGLDKLSEQEVEAYGYVDKLREQDDRLH